MNGVSSPESCGLRGRGIDRVFGLSRGTTVPGSMEEVRRLLVKC